jgi:hypothetical protein
VSYVAVLLINAIDFTAANPGADPVAFHVQLLTPQRKSTPSLRSP